MVAFNIGATEVADLLIRSISKATCMSFLLVGNPSDCSGSQERFWTSQNDRNKELRQRPQGVKFIKMETTKEEIYKDILEKRQRINEFAEDFIFIFDNNLCVQYCNGHAAKHLGCCQTEVIGKPLSDLFPPNSYETLKQNLQTVFKSGESFFSENSITFANKEFWLDSRFAPIKENDVVKNVLVISRDITET